MVFQKIHYKRIISVRAKDFYLDALHIQSKRLSSCKRKIILLKLSAHGALVKITTEMCSSWLNMALDVQPVTSAFWGIVCNTRKV